MASITGALRKLYAKLGGTDTGSQTIDGMINKVADGAHYNTYFYSISEGSF